MPMGFVAIGGALWSGAWILLGEYRRLFLSDPRRAMTTEVFAVVADLGGPGYLAAVLFLSGLLLLTIGLGLLGVAVYLFVFR